VGAVAPAWVLLVTEAASLNVRYGPLSVRFQSADPRVRFLARPPHDRFVVGCEHSHCVLDWSFDSVRPSTAIEALMEMRSWETRLLPDGREETIFFETPARVPMLALTFDSGFQAASVVQTPLRDEKYRVNVGRYPLDEFIAARLLGRHAAVLLHASTAVVADDAYVFAGHSGAGKSTIASIAEQSGAEILSDDRTILTHDGESVRAWGTPWHGSHRRARHGNAQVRGIFLLEKDSVNSVSPLDPSCALKELFVRLVQPRVSKDEVGNNLDVLSSVVQSARIGTLRFRPELEAFQRVVHPGW
jgi:hypothetical protein